MIRRILYWGAVLIVSLAVVVGLVYYLESRDGSAVGGASPSTSTPAGTQGG
ncbi:MAG: hypothetical protein QOG62_1687 [Thermoleophilaceae bacterium]|nr:hypothetical protein [Thermoleophilaceae bacterium]